MEEIIIKEITRKDSGLVVVKYNGNRTATIAKWQAQEADYIEKDVGVGGQVKVEIVVKGDYTNITKVDFESAVKGVYRREYFTGGHEDCQNEAKQIIDSAQATGGLMSVKDISITAQCLTKAWAVSIQAKNTIVEPQGILDAYRFFVKELEENG